MHAIIAHELAEHETGSHEAALKAVPATRLPVGVIRPAAAMSRYALRSSDVSSARSPDRWRLSRVRAALDSAIARGKASSVIDEAKLYPTPGSRGMSAAAHSHALGVRRPEK